MRMCLQEFLGCSNRDHWGTVHRFALKLVAARAGEAVKIVHAAIGRTQKIAQAGRYLCSMACLIRDTRLIYAVVCRELDLERRPTSLSIFAFHSLRAVLHKIRLYAIAIVATAVYSRASSAGSYLSWFPA